MNGGYFYVDGKFSRKTTFIATTELFVCATLNLFLKGFVIFSSVNYFLVLFIKYENVRLTIKKICFTKNLDNNLFWK